MTALGKVYAVVRAWRCGTWVYAVVNVPAGTILMYSLHGAHCRMIAKWFNEWDLIDCGEHPYDGSVWEVDPLS